MSNLLNISSSPHVRDKSSTKSIMWDVFLALMPATIVGIYNFGYKAAILIVACVAAAVLTEYIWQKAMKLPVTVSDGSAALTGLLLALNLSSTFPVWMAILGSVFAIIIVKQLFGGLGQNFMNPALGARCFLMISFAGKMTSFTYDGVTGATPLAIIKNGDKATAVADLLASGDGKTQVATSVLKMFIGTIGGTIGETSALALLLGAAYLLIKKVYAILEHLQYLHLYLADVVLISHILQLKSAVVVLCSVHSSWQQIMLQVLSHRRDRLYLVYFLVFLQEYSVFSVHLQKVFLTPSLSVTC